MIRVSERAKKSLFTVVNAAHNTTKKYIGDEVHIEILDYKYLINGQIKGTATVFNKNNKIIGVLPEDTNKNMGLIRLGAPVILKEVLFENMHYMNNIQDLYISEISNCGRFVFINTFNQNTRILLRNLRNISENKIKQEQELKFKNQKCKNEETRKKIQGSTQVKIQMQQVLKAIEQGKSRAEAAKIANVNLATVTGWYIDGSENKGPNTKMFYEEFNRIKKELNKKKSRQEKVSKAPTKRRIKKRKSIKSDGGNPYYPPTKSEDVILKSKVDTSERAKNLRKDMATKY